MLYKTYNVILDGHEAPTVPDVIKYVQGMVWSEIETTEQNIMCDRYLDTVDGIGIYYDYGADYYFFTDES